MSRNWLRIGAAASILLLLAAVLGRVWERASQAWISTSTPVVARYLVDETGKLDEAQALAKAGAGELKELPDGKPNLFYSSAAHWFLYPLPDAQGASGETFVFFFSESSINRVDFALLADGQVIRRGKSGTSVPPPERAMGNRRVAFEYEPVAGQNLSILVRYASHNVIDASAQIAPLRAFEQRVAIENLVRGLYYCVFIALVLYNLFLFISSVYPEYLYYVMFAVVTYGTQSGTDGYLDLFFFHERFPWSEHLIASSACIGIFGVLFAQRFLDLVHHHPRIHKAMYGSIGVMLLSIALHFLGVTKASIIVRDASLFLGMGLILASSFIRMRRGYSPATYFFIAWTFLIVFTSFFMLMLDGVLPRTPFTEFALHVASSGELILMSLGLGDRIRRLNEEKSEERSRADLKEARASQLSTLVHVLCHDLLNPLTITMAVVHKKNKKPDPSDALDWARITRATNAQLAIVNSVREMEAVVYGKKDVHLTPIKLADLYDNVVFTFKEKFEEKQLELSSNFGHGAPMEGALVLAEPSSFTHTVFANLVSNAIKFSHPGGKIELSASAADGKSVVITVRDYGIGMPASLCADVFEMTKRTTRPGTKGEKGTGFGMPLVKAYVERYGGRIAVESVLPQENSADHGTRFHVTLQRA